MPGCGSGRNGFGASGECGVVVGTVVVGLQVLETEYLSSSPGSTS